VLNVITLQIKNKKMLGAAPKKYLHLKKGVAKLLSALYSLRY